MPSRKPQLAMPVKPIGPVGPFVGLAYASLSRLRRLGKKHLSNARNPGVNWIMSQVGRFRRRIILRRTTFVGITGSCGKTTATLLTGRILSAAGSCYVKAGGNTQLTAARTVLAIAPSTRFCVHEAGAHKRGGIARTVRILRPDIGIVISIGEDHYREFRGREGVAQEKAALVELLPATGTAILNIDDPYVRQMASRSRAKLLTFGCSAEADIRAIEITGDWPNRLSLTATHGGQAARFRTRLVGEYWIPSVLAAVACGIACGLELKDCATALEGFESAFGRSSAHTVPGGPVYIFDQKVPCWAIPSSLDFIAKARAPRKTIVFGTISDHSGASSPRYRRVARDALAVADRVVFVGRQSGHVDKLRTGDARNRLFSFPTAYQASNYLAQNALPDELIVVKCSMYADHLERLLLSQLDQVVCWREGCGRQRACPDCRAYRKPSPPPLGLADSRIAHASKAKRSPAHSSPGAL